MLKSRGAASAGRGARHWRRGPGDPVGGAEVPPQEDLEQREAIISRIERQAKCFEQSGRAAAWRAGAADAEMNRLISEVNEPLRICCRARQCARTGDAARR